MLVESQVLPDGAYTWVVEATDDAGRTEKTEGQITLQGGDTTLPELHNFTVVPQEFRPNQDGMRTTGFRSPTTSPRTPSGSRSTWSRPDPRPGEPKLKYPIAEKPSVDGEAGRRRLSRLRLRWRRRSERRAAAGRRLHHLRRGRGQGRQPGGGLLDADHQGGRQAPRRGGRRRDRLAGRDEPGGGRAAGPDALFHRHGREHRPGAHPHRRALAGSERTSSARTTTPWRSRRARSPGISRPASGASASTSTPPAWTSPSAGPSAARKTWKSASSTASRSTTCCRASAARSAAASSSTRSRRSARNFWWGGLIHEFVEVANNDVDRIRWRWARR